MEPLLTAHVREPHCFTLDFYLQHEGYAGFRTALGLSPDEVIERVKASGLRGRGGAGFPTDGMQRSSPLSSGACRYLGHR
jgi:NADH-quinone oxidoreductase subunit F